MNKAALLCFLGLLSLNQASSVAPPQPQPWPSRFSVAFHEEQHLSIVPISSNAGAWYYDYGNGRARFDHLQGQRDNFCQRRGLNLHDRSGDCLLYFNTAGMYVHYPREKQCCRACGPAEGCAVLKPTWLAGAKYLGTDIVSGMVCHGWEIQGAMSVDRWYATEDGMPCQYWEKLIIPHAPHITHTITFNISTYKLEPIQTSVFDVPKYCNITCPNPYT